MTPSIFRCDVDPPDFGGFMTQRKFARNPGAKTGSGIILPAHYYQVTMEQM